MGPVQFWLLTAMGVDPNLAIRVAFAISLAVIIPTAISGTTGHYLKGAVKLKTTFYRGLSGFIAAYIGATTTSNTPEDTIKLIFGVVIICLALWMLTSQNPKTKESTRNSILLTLQWD